MTWLPGSGWSQGRGGARVGVEGLSKKSQMLPGVDACHTTLAEMPNIWAMEPEETTSRSQTGPRPPVEGWVYQPTYKTFDQNLFLSKRNSGEKDRAETEGVADSDQPILRPIP